MNKYFIIIYIFLGLFFVSCEFNHSKNNIQKEIKFEKIIEKTYLKLANMYDMSIIGKGGGRTSGMENLVTIIFERKRGVVSKEEGRKMIVDCVEELLTVINEEKEIRPLLRNYPFTPKNIDVTIINYKTDGSSLLDPDIKVFSSYEGKLFYDTQDPVDRYKYKSETSEPYEEALAIVRKEQQQALIDREL